MKKPDNFNEYKREFPKETQAMLEQLRSTIIKAAPNAEEVISYGMPAFKMNGMLVWIAAYTKHIGFYPTTSGINAFKKELSVYKWAKGSVQFPLNKPIPLRLVFKIVKYRVAENMEKKKLKKNN